MEDDLEIKKDNMEIMKDDQKRIEEEKLEELRLHDQKMLFIG
jgi:hypothetical protein